MASWAIIGAGDVAQRHVGPGLHAAGQAIKAVWSPRQEQRDAVAARFGAAGPDTAEQAMALADAVYICTPVDCHVDLALAAIRQGRHVLVEKPLSLGLGHSAALQAALAAHPELAFRVAYYRRYWPLIAQLRRIIVAEELGQLQHVSAAFAHPYLPLASRPTWRLDPARAGGGIIADAGCHRLDYLVALLGWPASAAVSGVHHHGEQVESEAIITLAWDSGTTGRLGLSWIDDPCDELTLSFAAGEVSWTAARPELLSIKTRSGPRQLPLVQPAHPLEPMLRHFAGAIERCHTGINPLERNTAVAEAWQFDALLTDLICQAQAASKQALPA
jgi:predicted dehydrogenase